MDIAKLNVVRKEVTGAAYPMYTVQPNTHLPLAEDIFSQLLQARAVICMTERINSQEKSRSVADTYHSFSVMSSVILE